MRIGVITSNDNFLKPVLTEFARRGHDVMVYVHTPDPAQNMYQLGQLRAQVERVFVDWAQSPVDQVLAEFDCPVFVRVHRIEAFNTEWIASQPWQKCAAMFFIAEHVRDRFAAAWIEPPRQVVTLPHVGIDPDFWTPDPDARSFEPPWTVTLAGFLVPKKRAYTAIQMVADLGENWALEIVGSGQDNEYHLHCSHIIERTGMNKRFRGQAMVPQADLLPIYQRAHFILSNSIVEGCHTTVAEGMACGAVPLCNAWEGVEKVFPAEWVFETPKGFYALAEKWEAMSIEERRAASEAARAHVLPAYGTDVCAGKIVGVVTGPIDATSVGEWYSTVFLQHMTEQDGNPRQGLCFSEALRLLAKRPDGPKSYLDVGCGTGWVARQVAKSGEASAAGQDVAEGLIGFGIEQAQAEQLSDLQFAVADATQALIVGPHDVVSCFDALEHIPVRLHGALITRIAAELKPGGYFVARIPHMAGRDNQIVEERVFPKVVRQHCKLAGLTVVEFGPDANGYFSIVARKAGGAE